VQPREQIRVVEVSHDQPKRWLADQSSEIVSCRGVAFRASSVDPDHVDALPDEGLGQV